MFDEIIRECLSGFGMEIDGAQLARLGQFSDFLLEKNKVMNLTAIKEPGEVARRHMADSLFLYTCADLRGKRILDIGTGAGFPGMPLKLYDPGLDITMLDSTAKRINFINEAAARQGIEVSTIAARAEDAVKELRGSFDIVTSRAVAPLNILTELSMPFLRKDGLFLPMKSFNDAEAEEERRAARAIAFMGGRLEGRREYSVEPGVKRQVLVIRRVAPSPKGYPRSYAAISKKPL